MKKNHLMSSRRDECVDVMTCVNNHSVCVGCDALMDGRACPLCRDVRGDRIDTTLATLASNMSFVTMFVTDMDKENGE